MNLDDDRRGDRRPSPAVIVGLDCITGLQTARILSARGVPVVGVTSRARHWATRTRACDEVVTSPMSGDALSDTLTRIARRRPGPAVLVPCTDEAVHHLSAHRSDLPAEVVFPVAEHDTVDLLMDKVRFAEHARRRGLPVPRTEVLRSRADTELAADRVTYPCVLKPPVKAPAWLAHTQVKAFSVRDPEDLVRRYDEVAGWAPELLLQEWVQGGEDGLISCNAYFGRGGEALATFVARKVRQWPPSVGTSASGEECRDDEVLDLAVRLFGDVEFRGLAYLEVKRDARSGELRIIEPNVGRPTGRSAIAEAGGVELVMTAYCDALGIPLPAEREQRYGSARWCDVRRDAQAAVVARRRGELTLRQWVRWMRGPKAHAIWAADDPAPFVADVAAAAMTGARAALSRRRDVPAQPTGPTRKNVPDPTPVVGARGGGS
jgi:D-aspartate ligase